MKKILVIVFSLLIIFSLVTAGVMIYVYSVTQSNFDEVSSLNDRLNLELSNANQPIIFTDDGMGTSVTYPKSWTLSMNVIVSQTIPPYPKYQLFIANSSTKLTFQKMIGGVGDVGEALYQDKYSYEVLDKDVVRYASLNSNDWYYGREIDCSGMLSSDPNAATAEVCITHFFPGFGDTTYAASVKLHLEDQALLTEADTIVLSATE